VSGNGFEAALSAVEGVEGWLTDAQARRLWELAGGLRAPAHIVEIGSFRGRSAIVMALAAAPGVELIGIDPHRGGDRGPQEIAPDAARGEEDHAAFHANLGRAGVQERVRLVRLPSKDALGEVRGVIELLYVDGAHRYRPARDDIADWGALVPAGGTLLVHDAFSSIGVTLALLRLLLLTPSFRYRGRTGSLAEYRRELLGRRERARNALRQLAELPWFARNVLVKAALLLRVRPLARALGHRSGNWPY
jgi:hypothetical protein